PWLDVTGCFYSGPQPIQKKSSATGGVAGELFSKKLCHIVYQSGISFHKDYFSKTKRLQVKFLLILPTVNPEFFQEPPSG
ncbi:MAG: hypothetical protein ABR605_06580, partial [Desulfurivibrionaceae bacterium]